MKKDVDFWIVFFCENLILSFCYIYIIIVIINVYAQSNFYMLSGFSMQICHNFVLAFTYVLFSAILINSS